MIRNSVFIAATALTVTGCANLTPPATQKPLAQEGTHWITYDSSRRGTLLAVKNGEVVRSCAEPAPDTAYSFVNTLKGSVKKPEGPEAEVDLAFNATALALAGRDNLVLLAREAMFRLCEAGANGDLKDGEYSSQFGEVLKQIKEISEANKARADALQTFATSGFSFMRSNAVEEARQAEDDPDE